MIFLVPGAGSSGHSAGSRIHERLRSLPCLWNRCDRPRISPGLPACAVLAGFQLSPDNVWYCKVLLLFTIQAHTDMDGSTAEFECAFVSVMETMEPRDVDNLSDLHKRGSREIYEINLNPKVLQKTKYSRKIFIFA